MNTRDASSILMAVFASAALFSSLTAHARDRGCLDLACRGLNWFRTCDRPSDGRQTLSMRVVAVSQDCGSEIMTLEVENSKANNLPPLIEIDLGECVKFSGTVGATIQVALQQLHSPDRRRYGLACRNW
jgi:hypothetical protein